ncbi:Zn-ribbon domain-containing OB-fold protein [Duganella hordei]|jgi:uncharacterized OB-fold protein|uniref:Zn-ribbon domain-containing OB-fold protein n=1 Tax=Duganella hordei TaxID=2865934 RepID=UPI0030E904AB
MSTPPLLVSDALIGFQDGQPHLLGSQCADCGETYFPAADSCTRCRCARMQACDLGRTGVLWSWTVQDFLPKAPYNSGETAETFRPYGVGYVQMACGIKVEARLTEADPERLAIGMPMALVLLPYRVNAQGESIHTFAFQSAPDNHQGARHA